MVRGCDEVTTIRGRARMVWGGLAAVGGGCSVPPLLVVLGAGSGGSAGREKRGSRHGFRGCGV